MKEPMTITTTESMIKIQFRMTSPEVTWLRCTMANMEIPNVTSRNIPRIVPAVNWPEGVRRPLCREGNDHAPSRSCELNVKLIIKLGALHTMDMTIDSTPAARSHKSTKAQKAMSRLETMFAVC